MPYTETNIKVEVERHTLEEQDNRQQENRAIERATVGGRRAEEEEEGAPTNPARYLSVLR